MSGKRGIDVIGRLWPFIIGGVALGLDAYMIAGLLPAIAENLAATEGVTGLGVTAFTGAYAIAGPLLAGAAGRRSKRGLAIALSMFTVGNLVTAGAPTIVVFLIARVIAGAAAGVYSPLSSAVAAGPSASSWPGWRWEPCSAFRWASCSES